MGGESIHFVQSGNIRSDLITSCLKANEAQKRSAKRITKAPRKKEVNNFPSKDCDQTRMGEDRCFLCLRLAQRRGREKKMLWLSGTKQSGLDSFQTREEGVQHEGAVTINHKP